MEASERQHLESFLLLSSPASKLKQKLFDLLTIVETQRDTADWPKYLNTFGLCASELVEIRKFLESERFASAHSMILTPRALSTDAEPNLAKATDDRLLMFNQDAAPLYLRTKLDPQVTPCRSPLELFHNLHIYILLAFKSSSAASEPYIMLPLFGGPMLDFVSVAATGCAEYLIEVHLQVEALRTAVDTRAISLRTSSAFSPEHALMLHEKLVATMLDDVRLLKQEMDQDQEKLVTVRSAANQDDLFNLVAMMTVGRDYAMGMKPDVSK
ncbi:unnamed protein product [Hydatigera taeniaeformis]|uniref:Mediator of RNA polymerase II transcription subunit 8 n=1 Tax=Hydatigena taeniaeformis TaxID=6205 RepID=A0A0R3X7G2_HYDTA|nr:unnamed protein product [Hydatigera taeniaeformis]